MDGNKLVIADQKEFLVTYVAEGQRIVYEFDTVEEAFMKKVQLDATFLGVTVYKKTELRIQVI